MSKVLIVDPAKCLGCFSCMVACSTKNEGGGDLNLSRIKVTSFLKEAYSVPTVCLQCETAYCALVCPVAALAKNAETGVVELDRDRCIGCKLCLIACPFGNLTLVNGVSAKCDLCGGDPTCVKVCQWQALTYGEADEIGAGRRLAVASKIYESQKESLSIV